jgi:hypothetical protein
MEMKMKSDLSELRYLMLYPAEGNSSILEVSLDNVGDILHVKLNDDGEQIWTFFSTDRTSLSEGQIDEISLKADANLSLTDYSIFDDERKKTCPDQ